MSVTFKYKTISRPDGKKTTRPIIPLTLKGKESIEYLGLIDSGADVSAIHISVAELLGLDLSTDENISFGIGGRVRSKDSIVKVNFSKGHESYEFSIPVKVIIDSYDFGFMLLGRKGFFDKFIIKIDEVNERINLKRVERQTH